MNQSVFINCLRRDSVNSQLECPACPRPGPPRMRRKRPTHRLGCSVYEEAGRLGNGFPRPLDQLDMVFRHWGSSCGPSVKQREICPCPSARCSVPASFFLYCCCCSLAHTLSLLLLPTPHPFLPFPSTIPFSQFFFKRLIFISFSYTVSLHFA